MVISRATSVDAALARARALSLVPIRRRLSLTHASNSSRRRKRARARPHARRLCATLSARSTRAMRSACARCASNTSGSSRARAARTTWCARRSRASSCAVRAFAERVQQGLITGGVVEQQVYSCNCANRYACRHNRLSTGQAQRRHPNRDVLELRAAAEKLRARRRYADADELAARALAIDERERAAWCEALKQRQLGSSGGDSAMARLVARHDAARAALEERGQRRDAPRQARERPQTMPIALGAAARAAGVREGLMQGKFDTCRARWAKCTTTTANGPRSPPTTAAAPTLDAHAQMQRPVASLRPLRRSAPLPEGGSLVTRSRRMAVTDDSARQVIALVFGRAVVPVQVFCSRELRTGSEVATAHGGRRRRWTSGGGGVRLSGSRRWVCTRINMGPGLGHGRGRPPLSPIHRRKRASQASMG